MASKFQICLRVLDLADIIALIVIQIIAIQKYVQRQDYSANNRFLVFPGTTYTDCDSSEAYEFSANFYAQDAARIINRFNAFPIVLAIISLLADLVISIVKLFCKITNAQDKALTVLQIILTLLFAPIAFPISDFDYESCLATGLSDSIMNDLGTYATLGLTMLLWIAVIVGAIIVIKCICKKGSEGEKKLVGCGALVLVVICLFYFALALLFIVLALLGTITSLATGLVTGIGGVIEGIELYAAFRQVQDTAQKATGRI